MMLSRPCTRLRIGHAEGGSRPAWARERLGSNGEIEGMKFLEQEFRRAKKERTGGANDSRLTREYVGTHVPMPPRFAIFPFFLLFSPGRADYY
jgi:hypothetical protein